MTLKDKNREITDQAWNKLYSRLEQDGLLPQEDYSEKNRFRISSLKWVAGIAVLCIGIAFAIIGKSSKQPHVDMITLNNDKGVSTLISTLEDGSLVYLSESASLEYPNHFTNGKREVTLSGDAYFDIAKDEGKPFIIETKNATIQVLGTAFDVKTVNENSFSISVKHGKVKVTEKKDGKFVFVKAGETALLNIDHLSVIPTSEADIFSKYFNSVHFKDQRLEDIARALDAYSDSVYIEVAPQVRDRLITMSFSGETVYDMVKYICLALNLEYIQQKEAILITNVK